MKTFSPLAIREGTIFCNKKNNVYYMNSLCIYIFIFQYIIFFHQIFISVRYIFLRTYVNNWWNFFLNENLLTLIWNSFQFYLSVVLLQTGLIMVPTLDGSSEHAAHLMKLDMCQAIAYNDTSHKFVIHFQKILISPTHAQYVLSYLVMKVLLGIWLICFQ